MDDFGDVDEQGMTEVSAIIGANARAWAAAAALLAALPADARPVPALNCAVTAAGRAGASLRRRERAFLIRAREP